MADSTVTSTSSSTTSSLTQSQYQQPAITFSGLGSNIDTTTMINQLVTAESGQLTQLETWRDQWTTKITALQDLNTQLTNLRTTIQTMDTQAQFQNKITSVSDQSVLSATAQAGAASGNHQVLVNSLAQNEVQVHLGLAGSDTVVNSTGSSQVFAFSYAGGASDSIQVPDGTTLSGLAQLINSSGANQGVTATVLDMGSSYTTDRYRLMLTGNDTGAANTITVDDNLTTLNGNNGTANFTSSGFKVPPPQASQDAQVRLDGYPPDGWIERPSNTIADLIPGVTLNLFQPSTTATQITTADDTSAMQTEITNFVTQYNSLLSYIQEQTKYDKTSGTAGVLLGNYAVEIAKSQLNDIATGNAPGFADGKDAFMNLAQIGITTDPDETSPTFGQLIVDSTTLTNALETNSQGVANLMAGFAGVSDDATGNISYFGALPGTTQPGTYQVSATVSGGVLTGGTINGHAATVGGNTLTGTSGNPEYGLAVQVNPTDGTYSATVRLKQGVNGQLNDKLDDLLSATSGPVNILINNYNDIVTNIDNKITLEQNRIDAYRQRLTTQFSQLESVMAQLNDQSNYLTSQASKLGSVGSSSS